MNIKNLPKNLLRSQRNRLHSPAVVHNHTIPRNIASIECTMEVVEELDVKSSDEVVENTTEVVEELSLESADDRRSEKTRNRNRR